MAESSSSYARERAGPGLHRGEHWEAGTLLPVTAPCFGVSCGASGGAFTAILEVSQLPSRVVIDSRFHAYVRSARVPCVRGGDRHRSPRRDRGRKAWCHCDARVRVVRP